VIVSAKGKRGATLSTFNGKGKALQQPFRPPVRFVAHGTLVVLLDPAGALSRQQVDALRAAMSQ
jgi:hypothetical protein